MPAAATIIQEVEVLIGLGLLWRYAVSPAARRRNAAPSPLPAWNALPFEFVVFLAAIFLGSTVFVIVAGSVLRFFTLTGDAAALAAGAAGQFGMLGGVLAYASRAPSYRTQMRQSFKAVLQSGLVTFGVSIAVVDGTIWVWQVLLKLLGLPPEEQDLIRMFEHARSPGMIVSFIVLATIIAPLTEELIFRAGLFRYLRTRAPRVIALLLPALIFAGLHVNWPTLEGFGSFLPLIALALVFSLAYERTGNIGTTMVAHGLFNLNTIVLIFCGMK